MFSALGSTVECWPEGQEILMAENKSLIHVKTYLVSNSKYLPVSPSASKLENISSFILRRFFVFAMDVEGKIPSWVQKAFRVPQAGTFPFRQHRL